MSTVTGICADNGYFEAFAIMMVVYNMCLRPVISLTTYVIQDAIIFDNVHDIFLHTDIIDDRSNLTGHVACVGNVPYFTIDS